MKLRWIVLTTLAAWLVLDAPPLHESMIAVSVEACRGPAEADVAIVPAARRISRLDANRGVRFFGGQPLVATPRSITRHPVLRLIRPAP